MTPRRVAVLGGGRSSEHDISLASAASIRDGLARAGHTPIEIEIGRDGMWHQAGERLSLTPGAGLAGADVVFPALHGPFGEDGTVQGLLECLDVPYVGAGVLTSALCLDKVIFKRFMAEAGLPQVDYRALRVEEFESDPGQATARVAELGLPMFVKPARLGSSVGIQRVAGLDELPPALEAAFGHDPLLIAEAAAVGMEAECSVIGNSEPIASEPGEIRVSGNWYDYQAKYTAGGMELVVPAQVPPAVRDRIRELATQVYRQTGCSGLARVDFFVVGEQVLVNELNTMPGFTSTSVFPALFEASGIPYPELLDRLVSLALERYEAERRHTY
ncbi:MAG TPA: D-alanine--D-alanine ligase family protein [Solirubrobacteraceae bacterium]|nr:D-alanine--D-alanine ligase family protein [Solirubrobacteraceae bacterium]